MDGQSRLIPKKNIEEKDNVMTPNYLAEQVINHYINDILLHKTGRISHILDPCCGKRAFGRALYATGSYLDFSCTEYDITTNINFLKVDYTGHKFDWIISNPPWSKCREFTKHAYKSAHNVLWLITINHILALKARLRDMKEANFGIREVFCVDTPKENWPQSGFQLGAIWLQEDWKGNIKWT